MKVDPLNAWRELFEGKWLIAERMDEGPHETLRCPQNPRPSGSRLLSVEVLQLVSLRAQGIALKQIASETNRAVSTVSVALTRVKTTLKLRNDAQLVAMFTGLSDCENVPPLPAPHGLDVWVEGPGACTRLFLRAPSTSWDVPSSLSEAERQVLEDLLGGASHGEIALTRKRSTRTVSNQVASIFEQIGVKSRIEVFAALRANKGAP